MMTIEFNSTDKQYISKGQGSIQNDHGIKIYNATCGGNSEVLIE